MHSYLRAIGFRSIGRSEMNTIIVNSVKTPTHISSAIDSEGYEFSELRKEIIPGMGIAFRGNFDENEKFVMDYYFPYREATRFSTNGSVESVRESDKESYLGVCEEPHVGVDLIFYIQDVMNILKYEEPGISHIESRGIALSALGSRGKILLPVYSTELERQKIRKNSERRSELIRQARQGDHEAYEELSIDEMDTYSEISRRIENEDVLSIVNSYVMPNGIESDKYSVLGTILETRKVINHFTMEGVYIMTLNCNDVEFELCINERDVLGEPMAGRRFKGDIWMQGSIRA